MIYEVIDRDGLSDDALHTALIEGLARLGVRRSVLLVPPDITRLHSRAGDLTRWAWEYYDDSVRAILPALGTHAPMSDGEIARMFGGMPRRLFRVHDWRRDTVMLGRVPSKEIEELSEGRLHFDWRIEVNRLLSEGGFDLILSIGQVVPHEVSGMANYNKNIYIGAGGPESINKSHYLGAISGMERIMGRADTPVRRLLDRAERYSSIRMPIAYLMTVVAPDRTGRLLVRGLFMGDDRACFLSAAALSAEVNIERLAKPLQRAVVWLDPEEYRSTWVGNKAIYRLRMALADGGDLIVLAPGVDRCGEDREHDRLIRRYGYVGTERVLSLVEEQEELRSGLGVAAHLIHGSTEGRFRVTYCTNSKMGLDASVVERLGYRHAEIGQMVETYDPERLRPGYNRLGDEEVFFVPNPSLGLWRLRG